MRSWLLMLAVAVGGATAQAAGLPEPSAPAQQEAQKLIHDLFKSDYARRRPEDRRALALRLLEEGRTTKADTTAQFVLFGEARDLAIQAGDLAIALAAIDETAKAFAINGVEQKFAVLNRLKAPLRTPEANQAAAAAVATFIDEALAAEAFEAALKAADMLVAFASVARNLPLVNDAQARRHEVRAQTVAFFEMKIALDKLRKDPKDPSARSAQGSYLALYKDEWDKGLPMMAEAADAPWNAAAKADLANPTDLTQIVDVGDAWFDLGQTRPALRPRLWRRAEHWYALALSNSDGLMKTKLMSRLEQIAAARPASFTALSEATRQALPTQAELNRLKELYAKARAGNLDRQQEASQLKQALQLRLHQDLASGSEADFFVRCKADLQLRKIIESNGDASASNALLYTFPQWAAQANSQDDLAARLLSLERFLAAEKLSEQVNADNLAYSTLASFVRNNAAEYATPSSRLRLCALLKGKGVRSPGVDRYRTFAERVGVP